MPAWLHPRSALAVLQGLCAWLTWSAFSSSSALGDVCPFHQSTLVILSDVGDPGGVGAVLALLLWVPQRVQSQYGDLRCRGPHVAMRGLSRWSPSLQSRPDGEVVQGHPR